MSDRRHALTPDALQMMDTIARTGSFAAAARELGKVPSALTYSVRQLEDALDVLLFDRRSRQASLTAAGEELLREGRLLLQQMDAVANRVKRVASGWEAELTIAVDKVIAPHAIFDLIEGFYALKPPTRVRMLSEVMNGTWEALASGAADLTGVVAIANRWRVVKRFVRGDRSVGGVRFDLERAQSGVGARGELQDAGTEPVDAFSSRRIAHDRVAAHRGQRSGDHGHVIRHLGLGVPLQSGDRNIRAKRSRLDHRPHRSQRHQPADHQRRRLPQQFRQHGVDAGRC